ncbi:unnamed protein product [Knipowitschia caucasica]|uniref:Lines homolog 1 n=1 Tax=Knipowitschia caucasica TaxID=637954 RepID=A0AAV2LLW4_KNICA
MNESGPALPEPVLCLQELYHCVLSADCPRRSPAQCALLLRSCLCAPGAGGDAPGAEGDGRGYELRCVSLTVLEQLLGRLTAATGGQDFQLFAQETWALLGAGVMGTLLQQFGCEDQLVSHLSVTCAAAAVIYHLHQGFVISEWTEWCVQALRSPQCPRGPLFPSGPRVDNCVRSLTEVLRRILKGGRHELAQTFLPEFECSLSEYCCWVLSVEERSECGGSDVEWGASVSLLLDLLETLCALRSACDQQGAAFPGQCLLCLRSSTLLHLSCRPALQPALRRRLLLLLKKSLGQRLGEDWGHSGLSCRDRGLMGAGVLAVVAAGGLRGVQLEGEAYFGGTRAEGSSSSVDNVTVRALCLVLLKALELQCQSGQPEPLPLPLCLQSLWDVLPVDSCAPPCGEPHHCSRLSAVFSEQDDDMMEAAKAQLRIFLHHRQQQCALSPAALLLWSCSLGLNPHCYFLSLLRSLAFDHRVLLDFLISTETCFLEYLVLYLRLLRTDPLGFSAASSIVCPTTEEPSRGRAARTAGRTREVLLVDYSSSGEDSEEENSGRKVQEMGPCWEAAVRCLGLLLELVSRLHSKKLFPYNPSSLIKLLAEAQASVKSTAPEPATTEAHACV